ncbi:glycoside hydrolase family 13 protein [Mumia zhuanghuii]|uniref:Glycoside hydrolase family 13 protein n=2 Tax=Mumia zhuanghuii TaxID=2585211 RepID=A0A5C4MJK6_9ACTN|nr:glycoside hydrolase family 13 protein [Mumia zhuanghuii]TNC42828.1 glycoside hydrolase family 13 protein [Mumia zhuanghuii]
MAPASTHSSPWWRDAVCYQIYVRSFADANGDGVGDLRGITAHLDYLRSLPVDALWLTPFYRSPQADHGYDVADYRDVDPIFGTLEDFDEMLAGAHDRGMRVIVDLVPNHTSSEHPWFVEALAAEPGSHARKRYLFRDGTGPDGSAPPNNWQSVFGGPAWTRVPDGQWYLHLFDARQPDLNWDEPDVGDELESVLRFWLDRGVDGFRVDVAHGLFKESGMPDVAGGAGVGETLDDTMSQWDRPYWDQPGVHDVYRRWRRLLDSYPGDRMMIGEAWVGTSEAMARYVRPDEMHQVFNFHWLSTPFSAPALRHVIAETYEAVSPVGASPTWVLSNHDVVRTVSHYGGGDLGLSRAKAAMLAMLALPGSAYVYQGEELGLPQVEVAPEDRQDPTWLRGGGVGRDGCRVPLPWSGKTPPFGFSPDGPQPVRTWLPQPDWFRDYTVERQSEDPFSTLSFMRFALGERRELVPTLSHALEMLDRGEDVVAFRRAGVDGGPALVCVVNCGTADVPVDDLGEPVVLSSTLAEGTGQLLPNSAAWFLA